MCPLLQPSVHQLPVRSLLQCAAAICSRPQRTAQWRSGPSTPANWSLHSRRPTAGYAASALTLSRAVPFVSHSVHFQLSEPQWRYQISENCSPHAESAGSCPLPLLSVFPVLPLCDTSRVRRSVLLTQVTALTVDGDFLYTGSWNKTASQVL